METSQPTTNTNLATLRPNRDTRLRLVFKKYFLINKPVGATKHEDDTVHALHGCRVFTGEAFILKGRYLKLGYLPKHC